MPNVLCLLFEGFEEIEAITPIDLLRRAGVEVTVACLGEGIHVTGRNGITVHADTPLAAIESPTEFDLLIIPGGPGVTAIRADLRVVELARAYATQKKPVAAICAAPTVLNDAGLLTGKRYTSHSAVVGELPDSLLNERVVTDGNIITSRGAATALDFGMALVERLCGPEKAKEVATGIMA